MSTSQTETDRNEFNGGKDGERRVKRAVDARQGTKPSTMAVVLFVSLALAALVAVVLASVFSF